MSEFHPDDNFSLARKSQTLHTRAGLIQRIRLFFINHGFLEVETPLRIPSPAPEEHIEALPSGNWFLQTSPELCMKRLLAADYSFIFQISKCFRADERGDKHLPEFTMLEWYCAGFDYHQLMDQCQDLVWAVAKDMGIPEIIRQNTKINLEPPWEKITVANAFLKYAPVTPEEALAQNKFDEILVDYIEPQLGMNRPTFLYDYPAKLASLARLNQNNPDVSERFELYIGGLELANGFSELTDAHEQRRRFEEALQSRAVQSRAHYEMPEKFLHALENLPPCAGIALGIDRLLMVLTGQEKIDDVVAFTPEIL
ncbi:MAG: EF-P lysine aminoacylase GenX [Deltaproteobacteria bacterium HGW-Deltaproteobacteria-13]|nr:MAG: EF-P lysine aminoacylase GenX [Deltaproteobacteria bacterium HGW-Deltaproteobacteria-13]